MQINVKYLFVSLFAYEVFCGLALVASAASSNRKSIDGVYAVRPTEASDASQMTVTLAGLLLTSSRFEHVDIKGKLESVRITSQADSLNVIVFDSANRAVVDDTLKVRDNQTAERREYILERSWTLSGSGESGAAAGKTTVILSKSDDGSLRADVATFAEGKSFWPYKRATTSRDWLKFSPKEVNPTSQPKHGEGQRAKD